MANYRNLHVKIWSDPKFEGIMPNSKLLFVYLLTCPHRNESGLYNISLNKICFETSLSLGKVKESMSQLCQKGLTQYDNEKEVVWVVNAVKYQALNKNCITSIGNDLEKCSSNCLRKNFADYYNDYKGLQGVCKGFIDPSKNPPIGTGIGIDIGIGIEEPFFEKAIKEPLRSKKGFIEAWKQWKYHNDQRGTELTPVMVKLQMAYLADQSEPVKLLTQATANNWKGLIYDQKKDNKSEVKELELRS